MRALALTKTARLLVALSSTGLAIAACGSSADEPLPFSSDAASTSDASTASDSSSTVILGSDDASVGVDSAVSADSGPLNDAASAPTDGSALVVDAGLTTSCKTFESYCAKTKNCVSSCESFCSGLHGCPGANGLCMTAFDCANVKSGCASANDCSANGQICVGNKCIPCIDDFEGPACKGGGTCQSGVCK